MLTWIVSLPPSGNTPPVTNTARMASSFGSMEITASPRKASLALAAMTGAFFFERAQRCGVGVEQAQFVAGLDEIARHGAAHAADADHSDLHT